MKVGIVSLGCARNQLDSEVIAGSLKKAGFIIIEDADDADICIINTCAFIEPAREESIEKILEAVELKKAGRIKKLVICGCLSQLYKGKLARGLDEADLVIGTSDFPKLPELLKKLDQGGGRSEVSDIPTYLYDDLSPRITFTPSHYAYLKISEGCSNLCSYCIISRLRGPFRSRAIGSVVKEARGLSASGELKELNIIGQDTTLYGRDRYGRLRLADLLSKLCSLETSVEWIRLMYTHPAHYTNRLISVIRDEDKICKYLDLPVQHISDSILKSMNRGVTKSDITKLIHKLKAKIPGLAMRTSVIVGFPGETDRDFKELLGFIKETRFERLGAFKYSREDGTPAAKYSGQVREEVKDARLDELMRLQQSISFEANASYIGHTLEVLIDQPADGQAGRYYGRSRFDAPEVDGGVFVTGKRVKTGQICKVKIDDALEYDLIGTAVED